jgi:hypothetical protein
MGQVIVEGRLRSAADQTYTIEYFASAVADGSGHGEGERFLAAVQVTTDGSGVAAIADTLAAMLAGGEQLTATATGSDGGSEFSQAIEAIVMGAYAISGTVFEDVDFAGSASDWDGGAADHPLPNVDVELYDAQGAYLGSVSTGPAGDYSFGGLADGSYRVRARSASIGDADTPPARGLNATVPGAWPYPLPEMTWGDAGPLVGGQDPAADDTAVGDNAGAGDTHVVVTLAGGDLAGVNLGFSYELIVNERDDARADGLRSEQGSLRQFIKNANAITGLNRSWFAIPGL